MRWIAPIGLLIITACARGPAQPDGVADAPRPATASTATSAPPDTAADVRDPRFAHAASGTPSPATPSRTDAAVLPTEASSLVSNGMSVERAASNLQARDFARRLDAMAADAASHPETQDLTAAYRSRIERQLGPGARLAGFGCGMSLCMGAIRTDDAHRYQAWADRFLKDDSTPSYVFTDLVVTLAAGDVEGRFLFSTDPGVASAVMRATP